MTLFLEKLVNSRIHGNSKTSVITVIPLSLGSAQDDPAGLMRVLNSVIVDSVVAHLEQLTDPRTVQALEYHLSQTNTSMSQLCTRPQKISDSLYDLFGDSADIIVDKIVECAFKTLGFKWTTEAQSSDKRTKLANSLATLKSMVLEANKLPR
jgi:hypothetical protein